MGSFVLACETETVLRDQARWILAFDASCGTCREISQVVDVAAEGKLEVLSLSRPDVREWREQAFGADAPWKPTLIRVDETVAAWTGVGMSVQLVRSLGLRSSIRVLRALGELKHQTSAAHPTGVGRRRALRIGAGAVVAAGMMIAGQVPSFGATAEGWVAKNPGKLPHDYDEFSTYSLTYRKAIFRALPPQARSQLWVAQFQRYRSAHPGLTAAQRAVLDRAEAIAADPNTHGTAMTEAKHAKFQQLGSAARDAFGAEEASVLFTSLGPAAPGAFGPRQPADDPNCTCSTTDDWCGAPNWCFYVKDQCVFVGGCGSQWVYLCDGFCMTPV